MQTADQTQDFEIAHEEIEVTSEQARVHAERLAILADRLQTDTAVLEARIGGAMGYPECTACAVLGQLGWSQDLYGWVHSGYPADQSRTWQRALGCAYLAGLAADPSTWSRLLAFDSRGKRVFTHVGLGFRSLCPSLPPADLALVAGALLVAFDRLNPRTPWRPRHPVRGHLEALAHAALPLQVPTLIMGQIAPSYLATFNTAAE